jgi:hypothetical protein
MELLHALGGQTNIELGFIEVEGAGSGQAPRYSRENNSTQIARSVSFREAAQSCWEVPCFNPIFD